MAAGTPPPPPPPPLLTSPTRASSTAASSRSARQDELDALRSKGLAKIFNRHFTDTTDKINAEREAADVALNEIIARKAKLAANPKSFDKGGLTLTQLDALQMELKKRKQSVQQKERETVELYRRYVSQYGSNEMARKALVKHGIPNSAVGSAMMNSSMKNTMPVLHENGDYEIIRQADLETARAKEKTNCVGKESPIQSPPLLLLDNDSPGVVASNGSSTTYQQQDRTNTTTDVPDHLPLSPSDSIGNASGASFGGFMVGPGHVDERDTDEDSVMPGLTPINSATVAIAEYKLTEFLREETDNIRKMLGGNLGDESEEDDELSELGTISTRTSVESQRAINAAKKAEDLAKNMEKETAWMTNPDLLEDSDEDDDEKSLPSKPQWVAYYSEQQEKVYYCNSETNESSWTEPRDCEIDKSALEGIDLPKDDICDSEDTVVVKDYTKSDDVVVKNYTKHSPKAAQPQYRSMSDNLAQIDRFRPDSDATSIGSANVSRSSSRASKVLAYKRKRRLQRRRRNRIIVAVTVCSMVGVGVYKSREQWMPILGLQTARQKAIEEERIVNERAAFEAERTKEERLRKEEEERKKKMLEEKERTKVELAAKKKAEKERKAAEKLAREKAEQKRTEAELAAKKKAEEERIEAELVAKKKAEEERIEAELAAKKKAEEERIEAELAAKKKAEEKRIEAEIAAKRKAEEERINAEIAAKKKAEEKRIKAELVAKKKAEEDRIKAEKAAMKKAEEDRMKAELAVKKAELAAKKAEEDRAKAELLAKKKALQERIEAAKKVEEERKLAELEAAKKAKEERRLAELEAAKRAKEERRLAELEAAKKAEEERLKVAKLKAEEEKRQQEAKALKDKERLQEMEKRIREDERRKIEEEMRQQKLKEDQASKALVLKGKQASTALVLKGKRILRRSVCSVPFSVYLVKRCRSAWVKPKFDIEAIIDSMMQ